VSQVQVLKSLEGVLESFLEKVVTLKEERLSVLEGINHLDDIARTSEEGFDVTDKVGDWFAEHNQWINEQVLRQGDVDRINGILGEIKNQINKTPEASPAARKISSEINRWSDSDLTKTTPEKTEPSKQKIVLKRRPEESPTLTEPTLLDFSRVLMNCDIMLKRLSDKKLHILSVLDEALDKANLQKDKQALILSAFIIYYLKQNAYKVEPYVKRLKEAERLFKEVK
jgi:hypothetical protein